MAEPQHALLVLGPPRSGKTSAVAVPNILCAAGAAVVTSTKADVLMATVATRSQLGRCWLMDPSGTIRPDPPGVTRLRWIGHQLRAECEVIVGAGASAIGAHQVAVSAEHGLLHALPRLSAALVHADPQAGGGADYHAVLAPHR